MPSAALGSETALSGSAIDRWELALALLVGAGLAGGCYLYSAFWADGVAFSASGRNRRRRTVVSLRLKELQKREAHGDKLEVPERWVAILGTAFDVTSDPFFDARAHGVYAMWANHDVTNLLLEMGVNVGLADDEVSMAKLLDIDSPYDLVDMKNRFQDEDVKEEMRRQRRNDILVEWYARFHTRYASVAQINDLFVGTHWDELRDELTPTDGDNSRAGKCPLGFGSSSSSASSSKTHANREGGGKCPLGFGSRSVAQTVSSHLDLSTRRTIVFQGSTYDVTDSPVFQEGGALAHFVGHDVTYALACQSNSVDDLDVGAPPQGFSFEQQLVLEQYRVTFNREFPVVEDKTAASGNASVDLHALLDRVDRGSTAEVVADTLEVIQSAIAHKQVADIDSICMRTSMTPLHKAVEKNHLALVRVLVEAGADIRAEASLYDNETPLEMARRFQFDEIVAYLSERM